MHCKTDIPSNFITKGLSLENSEILFTEDFDFNGKPDGVWFVV